MRRGAVGRDAVRLPGGEADELDEQRLSVRRTKRLVNDILAEHVQHFRSVDVRLHIGRVCDRPRQPTLPWPSKITLTDIFHPQLRILVPPIFAQAAQGTDESVLRVRRKVDRV